MSNLLPHQHADISLIDVRVTHRDRAVCNGWGHVEIYAGEGRSVLVTVCEYISGVAVTFTLDLGRGRRSRVNLGVDWVCDAIQSAALEEGLPVRLPSNRKGLWGSAH